MKVIPTWLQEFSSKMKIKQLMLLVAAAEPLNESIC